MATSKGQRIGIWVIAGAMTLGTVAGFVGMILAPKNEAKDAAALQAVYEEYQKELQEYQVKVDAQAKVLSAKYYDTFKEYEGLAAEFDAESIKEIGKEDIKEGDGVEVKDDTKLAMYYVGWNPKAKIFDQSIKGSALGAPIAVNDGLKNASLIEGWKEGLLGMKIGGVRVLTIPSDKAYGASGSGEDIPANTPIKFVVMAIELPEAIKQPEMPKELLSAYGG